MSRTTTVERRTGTRGTSRVTATGSGPGIRDWVAREGVERRRAGSGVPGRYIACKDSRRDDATDAGDSDEIRARRGSGADRRACRRRACAPARSFARARLVDVELVRCDLAGCDFSDAVLQRVRLVDCRAISADFGQAVAAVGVVRRLPARRGELPSRAASATRASSRRCSLAPISAAAVLEASRFPVAISRVPTSRTRGVRDVDLRGARLDGLQQRRVARRGDDRCRSALRARARIGRGGRRAHRRRRPDTN